MDEFDKQVRKDAMAGFSNTKAINRTTNKINKNLIDDVIKPLAGKTPPGKLISKLSKIKNKFDDKDAGLYAIAGLPVVAGAIETFKSLKNRKSKRQQELGTIEYGFDTKGVDPVKDDNIGRYMDKNFESARKARVKRRQGGGSTYSIPGKDAALDMYQSFVGPDADKLTKGEKTTLLIAKHRRDSRLPSREKIYADKKRREFKEKIKRRDIGGSSFSIRGKDAALDMYDSFVGPDADKLSRAEKAALVGSKARFDLANKKTKKDRRRQPIVDLRRERPRMKRIEQQPEQFTPYAEDFNKGGFGALSVKAGIDNNYDPTHADRIAVGKLKEKGKGMRTGGICRGIGKAIKGTGFSGVK